MIVKPERLSIAVLTFYSLCLLPAIYIVYRHILNWIDGWYFLLSVVLLRIIGSAADIAAWIQLQHDNNVPNESLFTLSEVSRSIAVFLLLLNILGLFYRLWVSASAVPIQI
jgi:hypothetical protein